jgi:hypothetical protein
MQIGSSKIGSPLVAEAFAPPTPRIALSGHPRDQEGLRDLFRGVISFYKGMRSHGPAPAVPCRSREACVRVLATVSTLWDLLDTDPSIVPAILAINTASDDVVELMVDRFSAASSAYVDGIALTTLFRTASLMRVRLPNTQKYPCEISVRDGDRWSKPVTLTLRPQLLADSNYHRVVEAEIELFSDAAGTKKIEGVRGVAIESNEGGRSFVRYFPTSQSYQAGQCIAMTFSSGPGCGPAWRMDGNRFVEAWSSALCLDGPVLSAEGKPELQRIELRPQRIVSPLAEPTPTRVIAFYRDGAATWRQDVTDRAQLTVADTTLATLSNAAIVGCKLGSTSLRAVYLDQFSSSSLDIAGRISGKKYEYLGGIREIREVCLLGDDLLFTTASDTIMRLHNGSLAILTRISMPKSASYGLKLLGVDDMANIFVHGLWNATTYILRPITSYQRFTRLPIPQSGQNIMSFYQLPDRSYLFGSADGTIFKTSDLVSFTVLTNVPTFLASMACRDDSLYCVSAGARGGYYRLDLRKLSYEWGGDAIASPSDITVHLNDLLITDFAGGCLYSVNERGRIEQVANDLGNPTSLAVHRDGRVFVAEFSRDSVSVLAL